jgi:hypothetical protein
MIITSRRNFLIGLGSLIAAPAIVHVENIMPIRTPPIITRSPPFLLNVTELKHIRHAINYGTTLQKIGEIYGIPTEKMEELVEYFNPYGSLNGGVIR